MKWKCVDFDSEGERQDLGDSVDSLKVLQFLLTLDADLGADGVATVF